MTLAENAAVAAGESNSENPAIFEPEGQCGSDQIGGILARVEVDRPLDSVEAWDWQAGTLNHALIPADAIADLAKRLPVHHQLSDTGTLFDELHHRFILTRGAEEVIMSE